jgi:hypothetical protein
VSSVVAELESARGWAGTEQAHRLALALECVSARRSCFVESYNVGD